MPGGMRAPAGAAAVKTWLVQWPAWEATDERLAGAAIGCIVQAENEDGAREAARAEARAQAERWADQRVALGVQEERQVDPAWCEHEPEYVEELRLPVSGWFAAVDSGDRDNPFWNARQDDGE